MIISHRFDNRLSKGEIQEIAKSFVTKMNSLNDPYMEVKYHDISISFRSKVTNEMVSLNFEQENYVDNFIGDGPNIFSKFVFSSLFILNQMLEDKLFFHYSIFGTKETSFKSLVPYWKEANANCNSFVDFPTCLTIYTRESDQDRWEDELIFEDESFTYKEAVNSVFPEEYNKRRFLDHIENKK